MPDTWKIEGEFYSKSNAIEVGFQLSKTGRIHYCCILSFLFWHIMIVLMNKTAFKRLGEVCK